MDKNASEWASISESQWKQTTMEGRKAKEEMGRKEDSLGELPRLQGVRREVSVHGP